MPIILRLVGKLNKMTTYKISIITTSYKKIKKKTLLHYGKISTDRCENVLLTRLVPTARPLVEPVAMAEELRDRTMRHDNS